MSIRSGRLRHPIVIQSPSESQGSNGAVSVSWATHAERMAGFEAQIRRAGEMFQADARRTEATGCFWLRDDLTDITTKMRVSYNGAYYDISAVIPPEKPGGWLQLWVRDVA